MRHLLSAIVLAVFVISLLLTRLVRHMALAHGILDQPNSRSSHSQPTPRGGGLAIVVTSLIGVFFLMWGAQPIVDRALGMALIGGGALVAIVGFIDDRGSLSVRARIFAHFAAAIWAIYAMDGLPAIRVGDAMLHTGISGSALGVIAIVWALNFFNFMDGIDGIAASEAAFVAAAGAAICLTGATQFAIPAAAGVIAAASLGFLFWNWPPAKIFMGDVGSGYLGYVIAVLAIAAARENPIAVFVWLILGACFFVDATVTLLRRLVLGARIYEAHRSHAYQIMARRLNSHRMVTLAVLSINIILLVPMAWLANCYPQWAWLITLLTLTGLTVVALSIGAGRELPQSTKQA